MKEISYSLNTGEETSLAIDTKKINGYLKAIMIRAMGADIRICLKNYPEITVFDRRNVQTKGWEYFPLAVQQDTGHRDNHEKFTFNAIDWALNDELIIKIGGKQGTIVDFVLRYE